MTSTRRAVPVSFQALSPYALTGLTAVNLAVFLLWSFASTSAAWALPGLQQHFTVSLASLLSGFVWTPLTSAFSHFSTAHLLFNLYALWLFGRDVETIAGHRGMVHLYVAGGVLASLAHVVGSLVLGEVNPALGASGAVMAVAVAHALLFPFRRILLFFVIPMPMWLGVALFILLDVVGYVSPMQDGIAHAAHLGGAVYGAVFYWTVLRHRVQAQLQRQLNSPWVRHR